jgi:hypothetical protein
MSTTVTNTSARVGQHFRFSRPDSCGEGVVVAVQRQRVIAGTTWGGEVTWTESDTHDDVTVEWTWHSHFEAGERTMISVGHSFMGRTAVAREWPHGFTMTCEFCGRDEGDHHGATRCG